MDGDTLPAEANMAGLEAASRKLREAVGAAVQLSEEAQDQVADAMQGILQQLLLASRLKALPGDVLSTITRRAGRPTRRASRALSDAHGPLDCGLRLDGINSMRELLDMVQRSPHRFDHITSLVLTRTAEACAAAGGPVHPTGLMQPLCTALPNLSSLSTAHPFDDADVAGLAALAPHVTSLTFSRSVQGGAGLPSLLALTGLRSLAMPLFSWAMLVAKGDAGAAGAGQREIPEVLQTLSRLPCLRALEGVHEDREGLLSARALLEPLSVLSGLTSLLIHPDMHTWDQAVVDTLRTGFPDLAALALHVKPSYMDLERNAPAVVAALAERTALTTLQLRLSGGYSRYVPDLRCLSTLQQLRTLSMMAPPRSRMEHIVEAMRPATVLTSLHLEGYCPDGAAGQHFLALGRMLKDLAFTRSTFPQGAFAAHMGCLALVTSLRLVDVTLASYAAEEPLGLRQVCSLEVLEVSSRAVGEGGGVMQCMLKELAGLSRLRDLTLTVCKSESRASHQAAVLKDVHLWQLLPLCHTLTRLVLGGIESTDTVGSLEGPGLAVVGRLTCLHHLVLRNMAVLRGPRLHEYLLPLPASLRRLELESYWVVPGVQASLQAAANQQDCAVRVGRWVL